MNDITAILTVYRRPHTLARQLDAVRGQTVPPRWVWCWANQPAGALLAQLASAGFDRLVTSSDNAYFHGRFALALLAQTEYVAIFDDDSLPGENWLQNCLDTMSQTPGILGTAGVILAGPGYGKRAMHGWQTANERAVEVDLVGQAWFLRTEWLKHLFAEPAVCGTNGEDIELAARAWRLAGVRSFCPPHPAADKSLWGSTMGFELGLDEAAASRKCDHTAQRDAIVRAETAAGWQPLFARDTAASPTKDSVPSRPKKGSETLPVGQQNCLVVEDLGNDRLAATDGTQRITTAELCRGAMGSETADFSRVNLGASLALVRDPQAVLRQLRSRLAPQGKLTASFANLRHHARVSEILTGRWGEGTVNGESLPEPLRYFTRREIEKLFFRGGFELLRVEPVGDGQLERWRNEGRPALVASQDLSVKTATPEDAEEFYTERYEVEAVPAGRPDYGLTSIVIVTFNELAYTRDCLSSIRQLTDPPYELIVVDNGSTDGTPDYLRLLAGVQLIANAENRGFPAAVNQGIRASRGRQVLLLNNDVLVTTGWLDRLLEALHSDERIGLVGPCSNRVSGEQQVPINYDDLAGLDGFAWQWAKQNRGRREDTDRLVGFCLLARRQLIDRIGLMDERFGMGTFEDDDYCRRALAAGYRCVIARDAFIHHHGSRSFAGNGVDLKSLLDRNQQIFNAKWPAATPAHNPPSPTTEHPQSPSGDASNLPGPSTDQTPLSSSHRPPTTDHRPLSLCMIVRDNERTIRQALESIKPWVDEMIVVDTGSKDRTPEICREVGAKVFEFPWCDDFAAARNESLRHATGQWLFWMDSDDVIDADNGRRLRELALAPAEPDLLAYVVSVHCPGDGPEGEFSMTSVHHAKLVRNRPDLRFEFRIHEQIIPAIRRAGGRVAMTDLFVVHAGAEHSREGQRRKLKRDLRLLKLELRDRPNHPFALFNLGMTYADAGKHAKAVQCLSRAVAVADPGESQVRKAYALLAGSLVELGRFPLAEVTLRKGLDLYPKDPELRFRLGVLLQQLGRLAEAETAYLAALANDDDPHFSSIDVGLTSYKARQNLAVLFADSGRPDEALAQWHRVTQESPGYGEGWQGLVENLLAADRSVEAEQVARQLADGSQGQARLRTLGMVLRARVAQARGDVAQARKLLEQAVDQSPDDVRALNELCQHLFHQGTADQSHAALTRLVRLRPDDAAAQHNLGTVSLRLGLHDEAVAAFQASLGVRGNWPLTELMLGHALAGAGRLEEAQASFRRCAELAPNTPLAADALGQLTQREAQCA